MLKVITGKKPGRPPSGFSDALWNILLMAWDAEDGSRTPKRPSTQAISNQLKEDANKWDQFIVLPVLEQGDEGGTSLAHSGTRGVALNPGPASGPPRTTTAVPDTLTTMDVDRRLLAHSTHSLNPK